MNASAVREPEPKTEGARGAHLAFGGYRLDVGRLRLLEGDNVVPIGSRALAILAVLAGRAGELVSKEELFACVWPTTFVDPSNLTVHISALRRALKDRAGTGRFLVNIPGRGIALSLASPPSRKTRRSPAIRVPSPTRARLPLQLKRLVGREAVLELLGRMLRRHRLVTVVGAGGAGKTVVSIAAARTLFEMFDGGVRFADLSSIEDVTTLRRVVGDLPGCVGGCSLDGIDETQLKSLVILDGCEHLADEVARLAAELVGRAPNVTILATSREPLRVDGEHVVHLPRLPWPDQGRPIAADDALRSPAVALFVEHATSVCPDFELTDRNTPAVVEICRRLEGLPLAIELAAAVTDTYGAAELADRLRRPFSILTRATRSNIPRHRSLRSNLDWSYRLLSAQDGIALQQLGMLTGPFDIDAAIAALGSQGKDSAGVLSSIANLVSKCLVEARVGGDVTTYRLTAIVRAYALDKFGEAEIAAGLGKPGVGMERRLVVGAKNVGRLRMASLASRS